VRYIQSCNLGWERTTKHNSESAVLERNKVELGMGNPAWASPPSIVICLNGISWHIASAEEYYDMQP
jgi:hypothetical protein